MRPPFPDPVLAGERDRLEVSVRRAALEALASATQIEAGPGARAAIFLIDREASHLSLEVSADTPDDFTGVVCRFEVGREGTPCVTAVLTGEVVIVPDVSSQPGWGERAMRVPLWAEYLNLAARHAVRACWCQPIATSAGRTLGVLALYPAAARSPTPVERLAMKEISSKAALVVERCHEFTEHLRTEEALRRRAERAEALLAEAQRQREELETMLDLIPVGVAIAHDPLANEISLLPRFAAVLGLDAAQNASLSGPGRERIPYRCLKDGKPIPPEELPMQRAARTGKEVRDVEFDVEFADGRVLHMLVNAAPLFDRDGKVRGAIGAHIDMNGLKRAQHEIQERSRILQTIFDHIPEGLHLVGGPPEYLFVLNSRYAMEHLGRGVDEGVGTQAGYHAEKFGIYLSDGSRPAPEQLPLYRATRLGETVRNVELLYERPDGSRLPVLTDAVPIRDQNGRIIGAIKCWRDISERKHMEERLKDADRRKDEFLAMLAHELRNPLGAINSSGEVLAHMVPLDERARNASRIFRRQVRTLTRMVDDLLDVSRVAHGRIALKLRSVRLADIVSQAVEMVEPLIKERQHRLSITSTETLTIRADPGRLVQCISNVLTNAAKYTDPGGQIRIDSRRLEGNALLSIADTGVGIPGDLLPHIFDLYVQGDRTLERSRGGLGIGLSVVKGLIEMHGGRVSASSAGIGRGATFEICLPIDQVADPSTPSGAGSKAPPRGILIVEDDTDAAESLAMILGMSGHEVLVVEDCEQAIKRALEFRPEVMLLDIELPEIDAWEVARRIRGQPSLAKACLVAVTGYGQWEDKQRTSEAGFDHHLVDPIDLAILEQILAGLSGSSAD